MIELLSGLPTPPAHFSSSLLQLFRADCLQVLGALPHPCARVVVADPPYFNVLRAHKWDTRWEDEEHYLNWTREWIRASMQVLVPGGLLWCFGQVGMREHAMLHLMSQAARDWEFHDLVIWDRAVGYNWRRDSFAPAYEMALVLRKPGADAFFNRDKARDPYDAKTLAQYARDKRYKYPERRAEHLKKGRPWTNLWRLPSLKGHSHEKVGHPSQKPLALIERILISCTGEGDLVIDPFAGSGTTLVAAQKLNRRCVGVEIDPAYAEMARARLCARMAPIE
jgi:DNA modification methylase